MPCSCGRLERRGSRQRFFFFQEEDGIRDKLVTGVQTCALPIWADRARQPEVHLAIADPAVDVPGVPRQGELVHERHAEEVAGEVVAPEALHGALARDRPPDAERDGGLGHVPQHPDGDRGAVLEIHEPGRPHERRVAAQPHVHAPPSAPSADARRRTSSRAGSWMERSTTGTDANSRALAAVAWSRGTSSTALGNRNWRTSPNAASCSRLTPSPSTSSRRLVWAMRATSACSAPS